MRFTDFPSAGEAFYWLGKHDPRTCLDACCRTSAQRREPSLDGPVAMECDDTDHRGDAREDEQSAVERCAFCVFDAETSGLSAEDVVLQFAFGLFDASGRALQLYSRLWNLPPGVKISRRAFDVHKIGHQKLCSEGMPAPRQLKIVRSIFSRLCERQVPIVAHNAAFDCRMLAQTAHKHGVAPWDFAREHTTCTMQRAKPHTGLVSQKTGRPKAPSNSELYSFLHDGKTPELGQLHDALTDIKITACSFVAGKAKKWW